MKAMRVAIALLVLCLLAPNNAKVSLPRTVGSNYRAQTEDASIDSHTSAHNPAYSSSPRVGTPVLSSLPASASASTTALSTSASAATVSVSASASGLRSALSLRAGQAISGFKKKSPLKKGMEVLEQVQPATRVYLLLACFCTLVHCTGLPAPVLFSLDLAHPLQLWRPFTSMAYLGAPSMSMANSIYFLLRYGQTLESAHGTGMHAWFLLVQTAMLTLLGMLLGFPLQAQAMIAATIYASSRENAMEKVPIQFGLVVTSWQLPYCMMIIDCLSQQSASAAWPHLLGIFSGHTFHFFSTVWPKMGGRQWLKPPSWLMSRLPAKALSNVEGVDFRKEKGKGEKRGRVKGLLGSKKGRKLGKA